MRSLAGQLYRRYSPRRFCNIVRLLNEHASLHDGLFESNVYGRPYVSFGGLVLSPAERAELAELTRVFYSVYEKAMREIIRESSARLRSLGWPENLEHALRREPANLFLTPLGRFDFALDTAGVWRLMEFNSDTPSGSQEVTLVEERQFRYLQRLDGRLARLNPVIEDAMRQALTDEAFFAPEPEGVAPSEGPRLNPKIGFLVQGRHLTDLAQVSYYADILKKAGQDVVVGDISNFNLLAGQIYLLGQPVDAIYRLFPVENLSIEPVFAAFLQSTLNGWLKSLNNLRGFFAQSKAIMAWVWQNRLSEIFSPAEQAVIARHLPETYLVEDLPADFDYSRFIVKEFYGREGSEVYNGATLTPEGWQQCREWRTFVAQKRIEIAPVEHLLPDEDWQGVELVEGFPCVGSFIFGGQWGGCYTRIGGKITDSFAQFIPTLTEIDTP
jgi:glutathionylspermidine synthase